MLIINEAQQSDAPIITDVISEAFTTDPTWAWAFPDLSARKKFWTLLVNNALRFPYVLKTQGFEAVSVWTPPNCSELTPEAEEYLPETLRELVGNRATEVLELIVKFEEAHPHHEPHYYLGLLGTQDSHRGRGIGLALLRECLARFDAEKVPTYLESSNPINNHKYLAVGFEPVVTFNAPNNGPIITGMWRPYSANKR